MIISLDTKNFPLSNLCLPVVRARNPLPSYLLRRLHNEDLSVFQVIETIRIALQHSQTPDGRLALETNHLATSLDYLTSLRPDTLDRAIAGFIYGCNVGKIGEFRLALDRVVSAMRELRGPLPRRPRDDRPVEASDDAS